ncbi:MAG: EVE domain-containing protein [bacterium]|nr:EVE domain-containing protein [bacterium]
MKYFLAKTDPETYDIDDLERDGTTTWDGVKAPQAVIFLKQMEPGDRVLIYHSQGQATIVGLAEIVGKSRPDPKEPRSWLVDFKFLKKFKEPLITLQQIKASGKFNDFRLVKQGRLSTMDVPEDFIDYLKKQGVVL